jgi:hypothetical protein
VSSDGDGESTGSSADELPPGLSLGETIDDRYRVVGRVGRGGMGEVVEVEHLKLGRNFALKALRRDLSGRRKVVQRFRTEWSAMAAIRSEHVVTIVDAGSLASGVPYFVMERLAGEDLRSLLGKTERLPPARVAEIGIDACYGLMALHAAGLVHRDLKPENLFLTQGDDGRDVVKLLDLGVAKLIGDNATAPGALIGTARYMAPEQAGGTGEVGPAADVFSLGVILYEALAGRVPFSGDTFERLLFQIVTATPASLGELCPDAPAALVASVERALAKTPGERHESAAAFAASLAQAVGSSRARGARGQSSFASRKWGATTVDGSHDGSGVTSNAPGTFTPPRAIAKARPNRSPVSRVGVAWIVAAGVAITLLVWGFRREAPPQPEAAAQGEPPVRPPAAVTGLAATVAPPSDPVERAAPSGAPAATASVPAVATAPRAGRSVRRPSTVQTGTSQTRAPEVAFDPENPYGK